MEPSGSASVAPELESGAARRLEAAREAAGFEHLRDFHRALEEEDGYSVSYTSVFTYHSEEKRREPPASYFVRVAEVTGARLEWLLTGAGEMFERPSTERGEPSDDLGFSSEEAETAFFNSLAFWAEIPSNDQFSVDSYSALTSLLRTFGEGGEDLGEEDYRRFGQDVGRILRLPHERLGFSGLPAGRQYSQYVFSVVNAILPMLPGRAAEHEGYPFTKDQDQGGD